VEGTVHYLSANRRSPDEGAAILIVPQHGAKPEEKAPAVGLRPEDPPPDEATPGIAILRRIGGGYARADEKGHFHIRLPDRGRYWVLVISQARQLKSANQVSTQDIRTHVPFFDNGADLIGKQRYKMTSESVRGDRQFNVVFD
jgi:hypothetical protein